MKAFYTMNNVGRAKYVVNHHNGVKQHPDGSPFFDLSIFSNKRKMTRFVNGLKREGYQESSPFRLQQASATHTATGV